MRIDIWSDFGCPFCLIGKTKFEQALRQFAKREEVEVTYRSFQLDPHAKNRTLSVQQLAMEKGMSVEQMKAKQAQVAGMIKQETGLIANYDPVVISNTFDAHRLVQFASQAGKGAEITEQLFHAYLSESLNVADHHVLVALGKKAGLSEQKVSNMLRSDAYKDAVQADMAEARKLKILSVPAFVFNNKYVISGAQSEGVFLNALHTIWEEERSELQVKSWGHAEGNNSCENGSCDV
ncbi:DsbA family oxidoreductase [Cohnella massiliensis]|uniref:DsbA family oxidoreductase n=1 Tax=Cohnella massiliensis TaxID=1816691 RepID=UPI0009B9522B|nr:DsbA family oxidoreductase [Cohnella massiliensis]